MKMLALVSINVWSWDGPQRGPSSNTTSAATHGLESWGNGLESKKIQYHCLMNPQHLKLLNCIEMNQTPKAMELHW